MTSEEARGGAPLDAGPFARWATGMAAAIAGERDADVPCGTCTACCRSAQFVHIGPDETDSLAHIPAALLFPAPGRPRGHVLLGYDERGHCPMLVDERCSIYSHRPRTCRTYDCRVFPACGLDADADGKPAIAERARRWRFRYPSPADRAHQEAVLAAAAHVGERERAGGRSLSATRAAAAALEIHSRFISPAAPGAKPPDAQSGD